jgi:tetratricopeptide (TPR) repeat protein
VIAYETVVIRCGPVSSFLLAVFVCVPSASAEDAHGQRLNREFLSAVAQYDAGRFADAASQLERLVLEVPDSFEVNDLLGLVYSAQQKDAEASAHLQKAVRLKPDSAAARTNLAANFVRLGKLPPAEQEFKKAVALEPGNFDANHDLGEFYIQSGQLAQATPFLAKAQQINPHAYDNGYDLSLADLEIGKLADARQVVQALLKQKNTAELHNLLGQIEEKDGKFVAAANEFENAAQMDPSESNLFDWASELLLHRTLDPAIEVFQRATDRYPNSPRLSIGYGMALYSRGNYDQAVKALLRGADLDPSDPSCYLFLSKAYDSSPSQAEDVIERFRRFAELQPQNPRALYYYAMSLWKGRRMQDATLDLHQIESLLKSSLAIDPNFVDAHLQLGNLYSDQNKYAESVPEYEKALAGDPNLADAHYRLGQAYVHIGQKERAQEHLQIYQRLRAQHLADLDKQRAEIRQFVYSAKDASATKQ